MDLARMLGSLRTSVQTVFPYLHGHQSKGLADAAGAMVSTQHAQLSQLALLGLSKAKLPSAERRLQRLVANPRLGMPALLKQWARAVLRDGAQMTLILDETAKGEDLRVMKLSRQRCARAIPVMWSCYRPRGYRQDRIVLALLKRVAEALPNGAEPTLLVDRGLSWPQVLDFCVEHGWHYVLRLQGQTRVQLDETTSVPVSELATQPGSTWRGTAWVFKKAGWRYTNVIAHQPDANSHGWYLVSDRRASRWRCWQYRKRMRIEQSFRDEKSHGFQWRKSRIRNRQHASRLLLIMALAMRHLIHLGQRLLRSGQRTDLERRKRRQFSVFQLALRHVQRAILQVRAPPLTKTVG